LAVTSLQVVENRLPFGFTPYIAAVANEVIGSSPVNAPLGATA